MEAALLVFGSGTTTNSTSERRGAGSRAASKPADDRGLIPCPCECGELIYPNGLSRRAQECTLTIEEIASNGDRRSRHMPLRGRSSIPPRVAVVGRHLAVTQALWHGRFDSCPADSWAQRTSGSAPPLQGGRRRFESVWVHSCGRGGIGRRTGLRSRRTWSMRVRPSPSVPWRQPGRSPTDTPSRRCRTFPRPDAASGAQRRRSLERAGFPPSASLR
jgi:hypothetical protein